MQELSIRQQKVKDVWVNDSVNIVIRAIAGSGKTSLLMELLRVSTKKVLFLAFNDSIQKEITQKIIDGELVQGRAMTLHSLGYMAIRSQYNFAKINKNKKYELLKALQNLPKYKKFFKGLNWKEKVRLGFSITDLDDISRKFLTTDFKKLKGILLDMDKILHPSKDLEKLFHAYQELREETYEGRNIQIDFDDMIYLPIKKDMDIPIDPSYVFADEAQDFGLAHHALFQKLVSQPSVEKWVSVGDPAQSIYGFSGAYPEAFELFVSMPNTVELPLDINYRCPTAVIEEVNKVYDIMLPFKTSKGYVKHITDARLVKNESMIICRNKLPLLELYFELLSYDKSVVLVGEDILSSILGFLKPYNYMTIREANLEMGLRADALDLSNTDAGRIEAFIFKENYKNFKLISQHFCASQDLVSTLITRVKSLFINTENAIKLCTIHKAKGLEADIVYILNESLIPSKFAKSKKQLVQEENLRYVARSRAREELYYLEI